jgi:hypothetical protein
VEFRGPGATDFENVHSLNRAFLKLLKHDPDSRKCLQGLPPATAGCLASLAEAEAERLSATPFLLLSFRERDDEFWDALFADVPHQDLFSVPQPPSDELGRVISAGLGFVWQLARQNPFAARLVCGASLHWCERLIERTFFEVLATAGARADVLALRCATDAGLWAKLLASGVSREKQVRRAAHISALQSVLTHASMPDRKRWAAAACALKAPTMKVADERKS